MRKKPDDESGNEVPEGSRDQTAKGEKERQSIDNIWNAYLPYLLPVTSSNLRLYMKHKLPQAADSLVISAHRGH